MQRRDFSNSIRWGAAMALAALAAAPSAASASDCPDFFECANLCVEGDDACVQACANGLSDVGYDALGIVIQCINDSGCQTNECINQECAYPLAICFGDPCPEGLTF